MYNGEILPLVVDELEHDHEVPVRLGQGDGLGQHREEGHAVESIEVQLGEMQCCIDERRRRWDCES